MPTIRITATTGIGIIKQIAAEGDYLTTNQVIGGQPSLKIIFKNSLLTRDEARRIAANIAKLPGLLRRT